MFHQKLFLTLALILGFQEIQSQALAADYVAGEIIIKYKSSSPEKARVDLNKRLGGKTRKLIAKDTEKVTIDLSRDLETVILEFKKDPIVEYAEPNYILEGM